jgi:hypothetical protein
MSSAMCFLQVTIYYADVANIAKCNCIFFADDTKIHVSGGTVKDVVDQLNSILLSLKNYLT